MTRARFSVQALLVLALIALVSWPEHRQVRAGAFWHGARPTLERSGIDRDRGGISGGRRYQIGYGSVSEAVLGRSGAAAIHRKLLEQDVEGRRRRAPALIGALGGRLNAIVGYARTSLNAAMPFARVVLRNFVTGRVEARGIADEQGRFTFLDIIPSGYVVELLDPSGNAIATSEPVVVAVNEVRETIVRAAGGRALASFRGGFVPTARETIAAAADDGVARVAAPERCASPPCFDSTR